MKIKIRGIRIKSTHPKSGQMVYGNSFIRGNTEAGIVSGVDEIDSEKKISLSVVELKTVGLFSGINDSEMTEIYNGDIFTYGDWEQPFLVEFQKGMFGYSDLGDFYPLGNLDDSKIKIIGNVFENPELIIKRHETT